MGKGFHREGLGLTMPVANSTATILYLYCTVVIGPFLYASRGGEGRGRGPGVLGKENIKYEKKKKSS